jgi:hypothetical protein
MQKYSFLNRKTGLANLEVYRRQWPERYDSAMVSSHERAAGVRFVPSLFVAVICLTCGLASAQQCRQTKFKGRINASEKFNHALGQGLELELTPFAKNQGWFIRIGPQGTDRDWAFAVNPPFRADNSQYMGNAYGETVKYQLKRSHEVSFALNKAQNESFEKMADAAMKNADAGEAYLKALRSASLGLVIVQATDYDKFGRSDQANWMEFEVTVTVPKDFAGTATLKWTDAPCPLPHR